MRILFEIILKFLKFILILIGYLMLWGGGLCVASNALIIVSTIPKVFIQVYYEEPFLSRITRPLPFGIFMAISWTVYLAGAKIIKYMRAIHSSKTEK